MKQQSVTPAGMGRGSYKWPTLCVQKSCSHSFGSLQGIWWNFVSEIASQKGCYSYLVGAVGGKGPTWGRWFQDTHHLSINDAGQLGLVQQACRLNLTQSSKRECLFASILQTCQLWLIVIHCSEWDWSNFPHPKIGFRLVVVESANLPTNFFKKCDLDFKFILGRPNFTVTQSVRMKICGEYHH